MGFFFILILDNLYALLVPLAVSGAHNIGFMRLHGGDLTTIEGEELATDNALLAVGYWQLADGRSGISSDGNAEALGPLCLAIINGDIDTINASSIGLQGADLQL